MRRERQEEEVSKRKGISIISDNSNKDTSRKAIIAFM